jgi:8-oxo-dGTP pyrophosphatase MutT (NUDIX family)
MNLRPSSPLRPVSRQHFSVFDIEELAPERPGARSFHVLRCRDWACVVPVTPEGNIVLVRQYRVAIGDLTLEPPGGVIEPGQTPAEAAARELLEETGYAGSIEPLGEVHPNPAILDNRTHLFIARNAVKVAEPTFDGHGERCETVVFSPEELQQAVQSGRITHVIGLAALSAALQVPLRLRTGAEPRKTAAHDELLRMLESMETLQSRKVIELARRLRPDLTPEDIRNPHDFPELNDPDWHYADGQLTGIQSVIMAVRAARNREREQG